ncbi:MAG: hypothetical protein LC105_09845 [Chitinophagales bacterium]|nr:hypothetical protein [Chitinophagales bacterium]MCZ2394148.1 hypothetical protein [Chitinophagales bacterium]
MKGIIQVIFSDKRARISYPAIAIGAFIIFLTGWYFTRDLSQSLDILFWDEANYMKSGWMIPNKFNHSWGPSYAIWYKILSLFESDSIQLYFLNYRLMTIIPAMVLFVFLAFANIRTWAAWGIGLLFLFATINITVWPKISHFCISIFLIGLILMRYISSYPIKISFLSLFALYIAYARPEFYLTYLAILGLWILSVCIKDFRSKKAWWISIGLISLGFLIQFKMGNPLLNFQGDRSALAFAQHFTFNYFKWKNIDQDFWITWMPYYHELFHDATSIKAAYQNNSQLFQMHILSNIQNYFVSGFQLFSDAMLPEKLIKISITGRLIIIAIGGFLMFGLASQDKYFENIIHGLKRNVLVIILLGIMVLPTLASSFLIYPRLHYILFHYFFFILLVSIFFFSKSTENKSVNRWTIVIATVILGVVLWQMPSTKDYHHFDMWRKERSQANLNTVKKLRAYNFTTPIRLLENEGGMNIFLPNNYSWVRGFAKDTTWTAYIEKEHVDIIYVTPSLTKYPTLKSDSTWYLFKSQPENYGFEKVNTGNHSPYLYIRKTLLEK